jgi:hypothetical protein
VRIEYLHSRHCRDEDAVFAINRDAVGEAELTCWNVVQRCKRPPVRDGAVRLDIECPHDGAGGVVYNKRLAIVGQRQTVREWILGVDQLWDLRGGK